MKPTDLHQLLDDTIKLLPSGSAQEVFLHAAMVAELAGKYATAEKPAATAKKRQTRRSATYLRERGFTYSTLEDACVDLVKNKGLEVGQAAAQLGVERVTVTRALWAVANKSTPNGVHK